MNKIPEIVSGKAVWETLNDSGLKENQPPPSCPSIGLCDKCGKEIPPSSEFCPHCGISLYLVCPKCKNKHLSQYPHCPKCGTNRKAFLAEEKKKQEEEKKMRELELVRKKEKAEREELIRLVNEKIKRTPEFTEAYNFLNKSKPIYQRKFKRDNVIYNIKTWIVKLVISVFVGGVGFGGVVGSIIAEWFWGSTLLITIIVIVAVIITYIYMSSEEILEKPIFDHYIPRKADFKKVSISSNLENLIFSQIEYYNGEFGWDSNKLEQWLISSYRNVYGIGLDSVLYEWLTEKPTFPSQYQYIDFHHWFNSNIKYPREAKANRIEGLVVVTFTVNKQGYVDNVNIKESAHPLLDSEVVRVISKSPQWAPAKFKGITVPVTYQHTHCFKIW